jgi:hypothetical protein
VRWQPGSCRANRSWKPGIFWAEARKKTFAATKALFLEKKAGFEQILKAAFGVQETSFFVFYFI